MGRRGIIEAIQKQEEADMLLPMTCMRKEVDLDDEGQATLDLTFKEIAQRGMYKMA
jgi:hypothetical protein